MEDNKRLLPECDECSVWLEKTMKGEPFLSISVKIEGQEYRTVAYKSRYKQAGDKRPNFSFRKKSETVADDSFVL